VVLLTREDRYGLVMNACRGLAHAAASSPVRYEKCLAEVTKLTAALRRDADGARAGSAAPLRHAGPAGRPVGGGRPALLAAPSGAEAPARLLPQCHACWEFGHSSNNSRCSRLGKPALPRPDAHARSGRKRAPPQSGDDVADSSGSDSGVNHTICHTCSAPGDLVCCSSCPLSFHEKCLPEDAMPLGEEGDSWSCPVCAGSTAAGAFVGNPQHARPMGRERQRRLKSAAEPSKAQIRERKKASAAASNDKQARFR
jgi:hypothetical protein